jgi:hypothetical protein
MEDDEGNPGMMRGDALLEEHLGSPFKLRCSLLGAH